jgi:hypothetical protein
VRVALRTRPVARSRELSGAWLKGVAAAVVVSAALALLAHWRFGSSSVGLVPAAGFAGWLALSLPRPVRDACVERDDYEPRPSVLRLIVFAPALALFVAFMQATTPVLDGATVLVLVAGLAGLAALWVALWTWAPAQAPGTAAGWARPSEGLVVIGGVVAAGLVVVVAGNRGAPAAVGSVALVGMGCLALLGARRRSRQ